MNKVQVNRIKSNFRKDVSDLVTDLFEALEASNISKSKSHSKPSNARKITSSPKPRSKATITITKQRSGSAIQKVTDLNKLAIVKLLKKNTLPSVILQKFPMYTRGQISAISAHVTMGTY